MTSTAPRAAAMRNRYRPMLMAAGIAMLSTAVVCLPLGALLGGQAGFTGAAVGAGFVFVITIVAAFIHVAASPLQGDAAWMLVVIGGLAARVGIYVIGLRVFGDVAMLNEIALGLTALFGIVVGQVLETRALLKASASGAPPARPNHHGQGVDR